MCPTGYIDIYIYITLVWLFEGLDEWGSRGPGNSRFFLEPGWVPKSLEIFFSELSGPGGGVSQVHFQRYVFEKSENRDSENDCLVRSGFRSFRDGY